MSRGNGCTWGVVYKHFYKGARNRVPDDKTLQVFRRSYALKVAGLFNDTLTHPEGVFFVF